MDHPLTAPADALVRPWRTAALVAAAIAAVELLILVVIGGGALVSLLSERVEKAAARHALSSSTVTPETKVKASSKPEPVAAKLARTKVRVIVLNGNGRQGAAAAAASRVERRGYRIRSVGNAPRNDFARSIVMYRPGFAGEAQRFGRDVGVRQVAPLDGIRVRQLRGAHVVYILGA